MNRWKQYGFSLLMLAAGLAGAFPVQADGLAQWEQPAAETAAQVQEIPARSAVLMDAESGQLLFEKNAHEAMPPASITKIMTMLLVMEALDAGKIAYTDTVTCSDHAAEQGGSQIWLEPGEEMTVEELLKATAVNSANDASMALAEYTAGSEEAFVGQMNARAAELGMKHSVFRNPTGLDEPGHVSSAYDVALMSRELLKHEEILRFSTIWTDTLRDGETELTNTNRLVRFYDGCTGLKTGTTNGAGSCLSASARREGLHLIAVTMGSATSKERFAGCRTLLDHGFAAYESFTPHLDPAQLIPAAVKNGVRSALELTCGTPSPVLIGKGRADEVSCTVSIPAEVEAPVSEGQAVGSISYVLDGKVLEKMEILAGYAVPEMNFRTAFSLIWQAMVKP